MFGAPGSGKGTHGQILGAIPGFFHCACGDVFRNLRPETSWAKVFVEYSSRGQLVPDEPTIELWRQFIENSTQAAVSSENRHADPGRHSAQFVAGENVAQRVSTSSPCFTCRPANMENLVHRMQRRALKDNRLDDANLEIIRARLKTYEQ